jgi:hypothetical protein
MLGELHGDLTGRSPSRGIGGRTERAAMGDGHHGQAAQPASTDAQRNRAHRGETQEPSGKGEETELELAGEFAEEGNGQGRRGEGEKLYAGASVGEPERWARADELEQGARRLEAGAPWERELGWSSSARREET